MLTRVELKYFKKFSDETFHLDRDIVLAGPNNSGKTTLLQAVAVWNLALQRWLVEHAASSKAEQRTGVPISRKDFTAIPLREMNLLWYGRDTAYKKGEKQDAKGGEPKLVAITLFGKEGQENEWSLTVTLRYFTKETLYAKLIDGNMKPVTDVPEPAKRLQVVHVPPFSGIGAEETGLQSGYQNLLVGQGKPGDILRNLLLEVFRNDEKTCWSELKGHVAELFNYDLLEPIYAEATDPYIRLEYRDKSASSRKSKSLDVASAGSGFHQVLTLFGFFYARPASVLLLDEPDAHLHVILQRQVYDRLKTVARQRNCQLLISTHSEVILEDTGPEHILSFYGTPHRLEVETHRDQVREALRRLSSLDILSAESGQNILYVEDESDLKILTAFALVLNHPSKPFYKNPFFYPIRGHDVGQARAHFFALKAIRSQVRGVLLLDGDNRDVTDHEVSGENLTILRWKRYEIENYLLHPDLLVRFIEGKEPDLMSMAAAESARQFLRNELPPAALADPLGDHDYLMSTPASKTILPRLFETAGVDVSKKDYFQIAQQMRRSEIHPEIHEKLDAIAEALGIC
jgi:hypothetical protein